MRLRLISITRPATNVRTPPKASGRQTSKVHVEISRGISYATPICEPTQTEWFAYDAWYKSCRGALNSLADPCVGGGWYPHFGVGFGGLPQRGEGCVAIHPAGAHGGGRVAGRGGEGVADRRDPATLPGESRLSGQRQDPRAPCRCRHSGENRRSPRPARSPAIQAGARSRKIRDCRRGSRSDAEPGSGVPPVRASEKRPHDAGRI
jgi:hypothetical protein